MYSLSVMMLTAALIVGVSVCLIPNVIWFLWWAIAEMFHFSTPRYAPFAWTAAGLVAAVWLIMAYGFFVGRFRLEVKPTTYTNAQLPKAFEGYKIVHISDLHLSTYNDRPAALQRIVNSINAQQPGLICFTGDLVTIGVSEANLYTDILRQLHATDGVVSVLGNHDMLIYTHLSEQRCLAEVEHLADYERIQLGWHLLRNEHLTIERNGQHINIIGVDNCSCEGEGFRTIYAGDLQKARAGTEGFSILLSHDPSHWRAEVLNTDIPLTLSGHTHSGQMRIFGWAASSVSFRESAGWYEQNGHSLYVNSGIGCTLPVRLNCPSEITVITLQQLQ